MKNICAASVAVLLLLVSACGPKVNDPTDVSAVKQSVADFARAANAGDAGAIAALMTDNAVYADLNVPVAVGKEAIQSLNQAFYDRYQIDINIPVDDVRVSGDLGVARGTWTAQMRPKAQDLASVNDSGSWIGVFARQSDGSWKFDWLVPNSDKPLPGNTATGEDEQALYQLEREWAEASLKRDTGTLDKILAADFVGHDESGMRNKRQALSGLRTDPTKIESGALSDMSAMVFGDTAVVHGVWTEKSTRSGRDTSGQYRWTDTFVKRDGRWQCVGAYSEKQ
jgi:uncharacterized protein (TIGR02246 family)